MSSSEPQTKEFKTSSTNLVLNDIVLLEHIFSLSENSLLAKCALVCSDWSRSALAILWDELTSVVPLLSILAPFEEDVSLISPEYLLTYNNINHRKV